ncbi:hypothetical protein [Helicobacter suis]|nr:hypothetical protein [Helicobacter suis]
MHRFYRRGGKVFKVNRGGVCVSVGGFLKEKERGALRVKPRKSKINKLE